MVIIPKDAILQPNETLSGQPNGTQQWSVSYKGPYNSLRTAAIAFSPGDIYSIDDTTGGILASWQLSRISGDHGMLTLNLTPADIMQENGGNVAKSELKKDVWSVHGVRNDKSLLGFCGVSASEGNRAELEAWLKEPDGALAREYKYRDSQDNIKELSEGSEVIAKKFEKGIDSVMRFYPLITRKRVYSREPDAVLVNLSKIDSPDVPDTSVINDKIRVPTGLSSIVNQYKWLKCQDDADENDDGSWTRTEAWMGAKEWDEDLYGSNPSEPWNDQDG